MTLKELIKSYTWPSISTILIAHYPEEVDNLEGYEAVYDQLKMMAPEDIEMVIVLTTVIDEDEQYVDVSGKDIHIKSEEDKFSQGIEFLPWRNWLGMEISTESLQEFSELEIVVHCLYEMTFVGFEEETIQEEMDQITKSVADYKSLDKEERKQNTISFDELLENWRDREDEDGDEDEDKEMMDLDELDFDNLEKLEREIQKRVNIHNQSVMDDFEGLSPDQMYQLQGNFPSGISPLVIKELSETELKSCPLLMQVRFLMDQLKGGKELKLTKTGALPTKLVKEMYGLGYLKNQIIEEGFTKLYKEEDAPEICITRILLQISSLAKVKHGKLSLTKKGEKNLDDGNAILREIISVLFNKFNWGYFDGYESEAIGRVNAAFSIILLKKYGNEKRMSGFYAEKYFRAFPILLVNEAEDYGCYTTRTLDRYFYYLGFINKKRESLVGPIEVWKTDFLDRLFVFNETLNT